MPRRPPSEPPPCRHRSRGITTYHEPSRDVYEYRVRCMDCGEDFQRINGFQLDVMKSARERELTFAHLCSPSLAGGPEQVPYGDWVEDDDPPAPKRKPRRRKPKAPEPAPAPAPKPFDWDRMFSLDDTIDGMTLEEMMRKYPPLAIPGRKVGDHVPGRGRVTRVDDERYRGLKGFQPGSIPIGGYPMAGTIFNGAMVEGGPFAPSPLWGGKSVTFDTTPYR